MSHPDSSGINPVYIILGLVFVIGVCLITLVIVLLYDGGETAVAKPDPPKVVEVPKIEKIEKPETKKVEALEVLEGLEVPEFEELKVEIEKPETKTPEDSRVLSKSEKGLKLAAQLSSVLIRLQEAREQIDEIITDPTLPRDRRKEVADYWDMLSKSKSDKRKGSQAMLLRGRKEAEKKEKFVKRARDYVNGKKTGFQKEEESTTDEPKLSVRAAEPLKLADDYISCMRRDQKLNARLRLLLKTPKMTQVNKTEISDFWVYLSKRQIATTAHITKVGMNSENVAAMTKNIDDLEKFVNKVAEDVAKLYP